MRTKTKAENYISPEIDEIFREISEKEMHQTRNRMLVAKQIAEALKRKGWQKNEFALKMGKKPSEITRWLSGTHNFTINRLSEIEVTLGIKILNTDVEIKSVRYTYSTYIENRIFVASSNGLPESLTSIIQESLMAYSKVKPQSSSNLQLIN